MIKFKEFREFIYSKFTTLNEEYTLTRELAPLQHLLPSGSELTENEAIQYIYDNLDEKYKLLRALFYKEAYDQGVFDTETKDNVSGEYNRLWRKGLNSALEMVETSDTIEMAEKLIKRAIRLSEDDSEALRRVL